MRWLPSIIAFIERSWCAPWASAALVVLLLIPGCERNREDSSRVKKVFASTGLGPGEVSYPRGMAVSPVDGCVFLVDKTARIQRYSPNGEYETGWRMPEYKNGKPTGLCVDSRNRVWVPDTHYFRVIVFDRDGKELLRFGERGDGPGQFGFVTDVALDRRGYIYVSQYTDNGTDRISKFSPEGRFIKSFADRGPGATNRPQSMQFDEDEVLWVTDSCHHRICRYDRSGQYLGSFGTQGAGPGQLNYPYGLVLEKIQRGTEPTLLVSDRGNNRITRFGIDGRCLGSWGAAGRAIGQLAQPWGVALAGDGLIYALDSWNNRVQVVDW